LEQGEEVLAGGSSTGRIPVRSDDVYRTVAAVFAFQQRTNERTVRRPGIDVRRAAAKMSAAVVVMVVLLLLVMVVLMVLMEIRMMVREFQARVAPVQRVLNRSLLSRRRQAGVGTSS